MTTEDYTRSQGPYLSTPTKTLRKIAQSGSGDARHALDSRLAFTHQLHDKMQIDIICHTALPN